MIEGDSPGTKFWAIAVKRKDGVLPQEVKMLNDELYFVQESAIINLGLIDEKIRDSYAIYEGTVFLEKLV